MLACMPHRVFEEWLQYHREEPFGQMPFRLGYASALLGTLLAKPKGRRAWRPDDFMPDALPPPPPPTPDQQFNQIYGIALMMGAEIRDPKGKLKKMRGGK